ncbi:ATP-binding protein [Rhizobium leguminosarum]|uniref:HD domain-containing protein n=1 Tax=Rhizobium leguminosarum TaxID=384 RepID=UPI001C95999B|nr:ATP-binding protein [Rhizobium leguminosarum]MBY5590908.1 ATP-binding protein [Rhizobium leguminosarum]
MAIYLDFRQTWLWRQAFEAPRPDTTAGEQEYFRNQYLEMREKAEQLVSRIATDLPGMTVHDVAHLDALWDMASLACEDTVSLNPAEAFVFGAAVLLHDAGMSLAAFPNGLADLKQTLIWKDSVARHLANQKIDGDTDITVENIPEDVERLIIPDVLRRLHAEQAEQLAEQSWETGGVRYSLIDDPALRTFYGTTIGQIAHSHWWSVSKLETELSGKLGGFAQKTRHVVDKIKVACLLRVADALHIDTRRAPKFMRAITKPTGISAQHWSFQERLARPHVESDTVVFTTGQPFDQSQAEAWWLAYDTISLVDRELNDVDQLLKSSDREVLRVRGVKGAGTPEALARTVKTRNWRPVDARMKISDVPRVVETLGGAKLYGDDPTVPLRELIQNAADAVQARRRFEGRGDDWGKITVCMEERDDELWLSVEDNGIGMSELVLTGPLLDFGTSFWRSPLAMEEFPGLMAAGMDSIGRFGIGFFSVFMLGDVVRVFSRRCDRGAETGRLLEFRSGTSMRPILSQPDYRALPLDGGTRVEVRLSVKPPERGGLLYTPYYAHGPFTMFSLIGLLAPNLNVALFTKADGVETQVTRPGDWLDIADSEFALRLMPWKSREQTPAKFMRLLRNTDGQIVGRAAIQPEPQYSYPPKGGWITVAGLRATRLKNISGVMLGEAITAARDMAIPVVDRAGLAAWATDQANLFAEHVKDEEAQAEVAEIVLECGGELGNLKIVQYGGEWLNQHQFRELVGSATRISVELDGEFSYDEDRDDVFPRDFRDNFNMAADVAVVPKHEGRIVSGNAATWPENAPLPGDLKSRLSAYVVELITRTWGGRLQRTGETRVVGDVGGRDIERDIDALSIPVGEVGDETIEF